MKDYFDIAYLASRFTFDGESMAQALKATFARRGTPLPKGPPVGITSAFAADAEKAKQWRSFQTNVRAPAQQSLPECVAAVHAFVWPPCAATATQRAFALKWSGQWD
jgi:hypothetical protein